MVLGGVVGLDRELANRSAGLRTHMLVAGAAAVFVTLGEILLRGYDRGIEPDILRSDPLRIIGAVITGVSFLGAGTIIKKTSGDHNDGVEGLTTAASLLMSAAIGMTIALRQLWLAIGVAGMTLVTLRLVRWLEEWAGWRG
jgi:putative Mg2+ transporter-C (MgtC) family protein